MDALKTLLSRLSWRLLLYWAALLGGVWLFAELTDELYDNQGFFFDEPVLTWFYGLVSPARTRAALLLSTVGGLGVMTGASVLLAALLWFRSRREAVFFAGSMGGAALIMALTKVALARPRPELFPDVNYWQTASPSFPSGHASGSAAFALTVFFVVRRLAPRWQAAAGVLGGLFCLAVSASRLYLQVHYPSDILAGLALGAPLAGVAIDTVGWRGGFVAPGVVGIGVTLVGVALLRGGRPRAPSRTVRTPAREPAL